VLSPDTRGHTPPARAAPHPQSPPALCVCVCVCVGSARDVHMQCNDQHDVGEAARWVPSQLETAGCDELAGGQCVSPHGCVRAAPAHAARPHRHRLPADRGAVRLTSRMCESSACSRCPSSPPPAASFASSSVTRPRRNSSSLFMDPICSCAALNCFCTDAS
jgi:hypothetical protein